MQPNSPMADELLAEIKAQYLVVGAEVQCQCQGCMISVISALVAEVERLRATLTLVRELSGVQPQVPDDQRERGGGK